MSNYDFLRQYQQLQKDVMFNNIIDLSFALISYSKEEKSTFWNWALLENNINQRELDEIDASLSEIPEELRPDKVVQKPVSFGTLRDLVGEVKSIKYPTEDPSTNQPPQHY